MIPGTVSKIASKTIASAASIEADVEVIYLTGNTTIATISPKNIDIGSRVSRMVILVPTEANIDTTTTGNIVAATTLTQNFSNLMVYNPVTGKWYPGLTV